MAGAAGPLCPEGGAEGEGGGGLVRCGGGVDRGVRVVRLTGI